MSSKKFTPVTNPGGDSSSSLPPATSGPTPARPGGSLPNFPLPYPSSSVANNLYQPDADYGFSYWNEQPPKQNDAPPSHTLPSIQEVYETNFIDPRDTYRVSSATYELPPVLPRLEDISLSTKSGSSSRAIGTSGIPVYEATHSQSQSSSQPQPPQNQFQTQPQSQPLSKINIDALTHLTDVPAFNPSFPEFSLGTADNTALSDPTPAIRHSPSPPNVKRRPKKGRRKWTDAETEKLILATEKHGIGAWTTIAKDPAFVFNDRSAADLKDRFRTCAPPELLCRFNTRTSDSAGQESSSSPSNTLILPSIAILAADSTSKPQPATTVKSFPSNILNPSAQDEPRNSLGNTESTLKLSSQNKGSFPSNILNDGPGYVTPSPPRDQEEPVQRPRPKRSHRRTMEDIQKLGITGPFKVTARRGRRRFTVEEDMSILKGLIHYGPQWSKIRNDPTHACIQERYPTDLRDRIRNKFPVVFKALNAKTNKRGVEGFLPEGLEPHVIELVEETLKQLTAALDASDTQTSEHHNSDTGDPGSVSAHASDTGDDNTPAYNVLRLLQAD
ncbi:telomere-associated protein 1 [Ceratocystis lukuohia]|uniref:Telomere-associated protein 1 n=1 Tax=Ceratocystis lukuohia TaxID=2019550 RepID=A0ABR4M9F8_9PEZI